MKRILSMVIVCAFLVSVVPSTAMASNGDGVSRLIRRAVESVVIGLMTNCFWDPVGCQGRFVTPVSAYLAAEAEKRQQAIAGHEANGFDCYYGFVCVHNREKAQAVEEHRSEQAQNSVNDGTRDAFAP